VTGENHPSCSGGYGIDGKREKNAAIFTLSNFWREIENEEVRSNGRKGTAGA
jgi:hypothetical protein